MLLAAAAIVAVLAALAAPSVLSSRNDDSDAEIAPFASQDTLATVETTLPVSTSTPTAPSVAPTTTSTQTAPSSTFSTSRPSVVTTPPQVAPPTADTLSEIYAELDAAARFFGNGGSLEAYADKIDAIARKWEPSGLILTTGYKNGKDYYYLKFGATKYCLERVSEEGTLRAYPTTCP